MIIGYKETKIGEIPEDWDVVRLGDYSTLIMGQAPAGKDCNKEGQGYPFVKAGQFGLLKPVINEWTTNPLKKVDDDYVLICVVGATIGKLNLGTVCAIGRSVAGINPDSNKLNQIYLYNYLITKIQKFRTGSQGSAQGVITKDDINKLLIPLPSFTEQYQIAEILSTADKAIEKTDAIIEETRKLKKGLMQSFFLNKAYMIKSKAREENTNLKAVHLRDLGKIATGTTPSTQVEEYYNSNDYMFIGPADLGNDKRIISSIKYISNDGFEVSRKLPKDSVMVVCIGATIGKVGITNEPSSTNQQVNTIIPSVNYFNDYIYYLLSGISEYLRAFAGDTATPQLNKTDFSKVITFVHIDFGEQEKIAQILSEVDAKIEKEEATKAELEQLKKGLMQVLLTGKVRVKA